MVLHSPILSCPAAIRAVVPKWQVQHPTGATAAIRGSSEEGHFSSSPRQEHWPSNGPPYICASYFARVDLSSSMDGIQQWRPPPVPLAARVCSTPSPPSTSPHAAFHPKRATTSCHHHPGSSTGPPGAGETPACRWPSADGKPILAALEVS